MEEKEALAIRAQQGDKEAARLLWEKVDRLFYQKAFEGYRKRAASMARCGVTQEDAQQESFFAFCDAVQAYNPAKEYSFLAYLDYPLKNRLNALIRAHGGTKLEPLDTAESLDAALPGTDDITLGDTVTDPAAEKPFQDAEKRVFIGQLHNALDICLSTLDAERRSILEKRYYEEKTRAQIAAEMGIKLHNVGPKEHDALRKLHRGENLRRLRPFADEIITAKAYQGTGWAAWNQSGSVEERILEYEEQNGWI